MTTLMKYYVAMQNALRSEKGQGMVEYGLILALVSVVVIVALGGIGTNATTTFTTVGDKLK